MNKDDRKYNFLDEHNEDFHWNSLSIIWSLKEPEIYQNYKSQIVVEDVWIKTVSFPAIFQSWVIWKNSFRAFHCNSGDKWRDFRRFPCSVKVHLLFIFMMSAFKEIFVAKRAKFNLWRDLYAWPSRPMPRGIRTTFVIL